jgi:hypothetical protein
MPRRTRTKDTTAYIIGNGRTVDPKDFGALDSYVIVRVNEGPKAMIGREIRVTLEPENAHTLEMALGDLKDATAKAGK